MRRRTCFVAQAARRSCRSPHDPVKTTGPNDACALRKAGLRRPGGDRPPPRPERGRRSAVSRLSAATSLQPALRRCADRCRQDTRRATKAGGPGVGLVGEEAAASNRCSCVCDASARRTADRSQWSVRVARIRRFDWPSARFVGSLALCCVRERAFSDVSSVQDSALPATSVTAENPPAAWVAVARTNLTGHPVFREAQRRDPDGLVSGSLARLVPYLGEAAGYRAPSPRCGVRPPLPCPQHCDRPDAKLGGNPRVLDAAAKPEYRDSDRERPPVEDVVGIRDKLAGPRWTDR
jgi:hypothetical protein